MTTKQKLSRCCPISMKFLSKKKKSENKSFIFLPTVLPVYSLMNSYPGTCSSDSVARMFSNSRNMIFCFSAIVSKSSGLSVIKKKSKRQSMNINSRDGELKRWFYQLYCFCIWNTAILIALSQKVWALFLIVFD